MAHKTDYEDHIGHAPAHHVTSLAVYFGIFFLLMVLTVLTVAAARVNLGVWNTPIAMAIAIAKATAVILWFMHVIHSPRLTWIVVIVSFLWLGVLFVLTFADYLTRHWSMY
ncbi:MAG TPA: cytochrome C oxidase subunit IV family protein [Thermoanaerobaculia bacterium]|nr:cytochrome C oxidase subunit IV family protein [Thermoanaerobaculia bacterium]